MTDSHNEYMREYRKTEKYKEYARGYSKTPQQKEYRQRFAASPKGRYSAQKARSHSKGIDWGFTFETWWVMWEAHWHNRGKDIDSMQMCRTGDTGPYSPENCRIDSFRNNLKEMHERVWPIKRGLNIMNNISLLHRLAHLTGWNCGLPTSEWDEDGNLWMGFECGTCGKISGRHKTGLTKVNQISSLDNKKGIDHDSQLP